MAAAAAAAEEGAAQGVRERGLALHISRALNTQISVPIRTVELTLLSYGRDFF